MSSEILSTLLLEYDQKKRKAEMDLETRKEELYNKLPRLRAIEKELNTYAINTAKNILNGSTTSLQDLNQKVFDLKSEKLKILKENNIPESYLQPKYDCQLCKDTGYIQGNDYRSVICPCLRQKLLDISYNKSNMSNLDKENFDNPDYKNLLFTGNTGLGKTFMTNCIANELIKNGKNVLYQTAPVLLETIIDNKMNKYKNSTQDDFYKNVLEADLLIIDDLGTECLNSMKLSELFTVLNTRLLNLNNKVTKTIISTNLGINNIFKNYEERIGSRIAGFYDIYYFFGDDLRFRQKA